MARLSSLDCCNTSLLGPPRNLDVVNRAELNRKKQSFFLSEILLCFIKEQKNIVIFLIVSMRMRNEKVYNSAF